MGPKAQGIRAAKKGIFFSMDAIIALTIMTLGVVLIANTYVAERQVGRQMHTSEDVVAVLGELRIDEVNNTKVSEFIADGSIKGKALNNTILEQAAQFWAEGYPPLATVLLENVTAQLFPDLADFSIIVGDEDIYNKSEAQTQTLIIPMKRVISGIAKDRVTRGTVARAYLTSIAGKRTARYLYYGGFVGQGNITRFLTGIPSDANITEVYLEVDAGKNFTLDINDNQCGGVLRPSGGNMTADGFNLSACKDSIELGESVRNNFTIRFEGIAYDEESFIAGGFLRVAYTTGELLDITEENTSRYWFPEIDGVVNFYTSTSVPGTITGMDAYLHYLPNYTASFWIGDVLVHQSYGGGADQNVTLDNSDLDFLLDYDMLSNKTIPLRAASFNLTLTQTVLGGDVDVILITDYSGSMKKAVDSWSQGDSSGKLDKCETTVYNQPNARRTELALCLDREVVDIIMDSTSNRLWPVHYYDNIVYNYTSTDKADLMDYYELKVQPKMPPQGAGKTCIGCALNRAYDLLEELSNASRKKFVIFMTDGTPTHCPEDGCEAGNSSVYAGSAECEGLCDTGAACDEGDIPGQCDECTLYDGARNNSLYAARRLRDDLNATLFTIGFGPMDDCPLGSETLQEIANIGNGTYNHSNNTLALKDIYQAIAYRILESAELVSQMVIVEEENTGNSFLYGDSFLRINYTPISLPNTEGMISLALESQKFTGCSETVEIDEELRVIRAGVTSYSSEHWTDALTVNGQVVYNLSDFSDNYSILGDPYYIQVPHDLFLSGNNTFTLHTGDSPTNTTGCSLNNSLLYTAEVNISTPYGGVQPHSDGCIWSIEYEDGARWNMSVPDSPAPSRTCNYTNSSRAHDSEDAFDVAVFSLLTRLDFDGDGRVNIRFDELDLTIVFVLVEEVPSLWGPTLAEVRTWQ